MNVYSVHLDLQIDRLKTGIKVPISLNFVFSFGQTYSIFLGRSETLGLPFLGGSRRITFLVSLVHLELGTREFEGDVFIGHGEVGHRLHLQYNYCMLEIKFPFILYGQP